MVNVKVGDKAPDFTLPDVDMKPRSLHEFLGKSCFSILCWSLHFYLYNRDVCFSRFHGTVN